MEIQWSLVLFTALTGTAGLSMLCVAVNEFKGIAAKAALPAAVTAFVVAAVGGCASITHLSHPDRVFGALGHPTSGIFVEMVLIMLTLLCVAAFIVALKKGAAGARKGLAAGAAVFGILLAFFAGSSYMMPSHPGWDTILLPISYLATVLPAGFGLYALVCAVFKEEPGKLTGTLLVAGGVVAAVGAVAFVAAGGAIADAALLLVVGCVVCGGVLPAVGGWMLGKKPEQAMVAGILGCFGGLVGACCLRVIMWMTATPVEDFFHMLG